MKWETWKPHYKQICKKLGINPEADLEAARILNGLLPEPKIEELTSIIKGKECAVFGAGPSLDETLPSVKDLLEKKIWITADGATSTVMKYRRPDVIVTDLDGKVEDELRAWSLGAWLVVHAHGDNIDQLKSVVPKIKQRIIGTTQNRPFGRLFNFGGFTDGDRCAFLAHALGARTIYLVGMDFGEIGNHSSKNSIRKKTKLEICRQLLEWLQKRGANLVFVQQKVIEAEA